MAKRTRREAGHPLQGRGQRFAMDPAPARSIPAAVALENAVSEQEKRWDGEVVRKWLESRFKWSGVEQDWADKHGRERQDDYDKAAAEEYVCQLTKSSEATNDQSRLESLLKYILAQDDFRRTGIHDERRFDREVRAYAKRLIKKVRANEGFENTSRFQ